MDTIDRSEAEGQRPSIPGVRQARRRRRPSGEPPPLPRTLGRSGGFWIVMIFGLVAFIAYQAWKGRYGAHYYTPVENVGLYWHFVDIVWIYLYPLFYLISHIHKK